MVVVNAHELELCGLRLLAFIWNCLAICIVLKSKNWVIVRFITMRDKLHFLLDLAL